MECLWDACRFRIGSICVSGRMPMGRLWVSCRFPMKFLRHAYEIPIGSCEITIGCLLEYVWGPMGFLYYLYGIIE